MPNPKDFSDQDEWMDACMHQVVTVEGKPQKQAVGQCLAMWRDKSKKKKSAADILRGVSASLGLDKVAQEDNVIYSGVFFDKSDPGLKPEKSGEYLEKPVKDPHITFAFRPKSDKLFPVELVGKEVDIKVIGVGNDGKNHGYMVELPPDLEKYYKGAPVPHITLSTSNDGKPVDTKNLDFESITPFSIKGKIGYFTNRGIVGI